jgi:vitamin B12/bleomycin/antimicrobial peptide transport system ATP-binding/permease protein
MPQHDRLGDRPPLLRFWACASGFWKYKHAKVSWPLSAALVALALAQIAVQYRLNYWNRDFFNALERRDAARLWEEAWLFAPLAASSILLSVGAVWGRMTTQRKWREWLTKHLLVLWLKDGRYRGLRFVAGDHQNAEYRICVDARIATDAPVDMALGLFTALVTAAVFTGVLWAIGGSLTIVMGGHQVTIPGYLVLGVGLYAFVFTTATMVIGRKLPSVIQSENQAEAEMLAAATKIRESGEEAARAEEGPAPRSPVWQALRQVLERWRQMCWQLMGTTMVSQMDLLLAPAFAWVLCAPKYLAGTMTLGELTQASAAFVALQTAFNWLVDNFQRLSDWRAAGNRVAALLLALDQVEGGREGALAGEKEAESQA